MREIVQAVLLFGFACWGIPAVAWSGAEHEVICEIAWLSLSAAGRDFVNEVRADDPEPTALFRRSCDWADRVRHTTHRSTDTYHYVNIPADARGLELARDCPAHDCVTVAVERYSFYLFRPAASRRERVRRAEALKFLAHFVGDLHQPLHAGRASDRGGNSIVVTWFDEGSDGDEPINLHEVWDSLIGRRARLRAPGSAVGLLEEFGTARASHQVPDTRAWTTEAHRLAEEVAYRLPADRVLRTEYYERALPVVRKQLWRAGTRLALLIESAAGAQR